MGQAKKNEDVIVNFPDLEKLMNGESDTAEGTKKTDSSDSDKGNNIESDIGSQWNYFLSTLATYTKEYNATKMKARKMYRIDRDIVEMLKQCNIDNKNTGIIINSILRTFVLQQKENFEKHLQRHKPIY